MSEEEINEWLIYYKILGLDVRYDPVLNMFTRFTPLGEFSGYSIMTTIFPGVKDE